MVKSTILTVIAAAIAVPVTAFVAPQANTQCSALAMSKSPNESLPSMHRMAAATALAGACVLSTLFTADIANAVDNTQVDFGPSSTIIAGRGGGRGGGRSMGGGGGRRMSSGPASYARPSSVRTVNRTYISAPPVVVSPFGMGMGYGYNPFGGVGLGYGLGAASSIGNEIRDNRQEGEIQNGRVELEMEKQKTAQLEQRLAQLEQAQRATVAPAQIAPAQIAPAATQ